MTKTTKFRIPNAGTLRIRTGRGSLAPSRDGIQLLRFNIGLGQPPTGAGPPTQAELREQVLNKLKGAPFSGPARK
jgi:hypothetical protein